jgi:Xaa-Pro dipeptidase
MTSPHTARRSRLVAAFGQTVDALLVTRLVNVRYLSGFTGSNGALLVIPDEEAVLATDGRYLTQAAVEAPDVRRHEARAVGAALVDLAKQNGTRRLGVEAAAVTVAELDRLRGAAGDEVELVPMSPLVEPLRVVKDSGELAALRAACAITDAAFEEIVASLRAGVTERDVAWDLQAAMRRRGASGASFDPIVAFGPNSAVPHHQPSDRTLAAGDLIKMDFGALYDGYHADMTRTVVLGRAAAWQADLHSFVARVQADSVSACGPGVVPAELNRQAHDAIEGAGYRVDHGLGHGVGLEIHEDPFLTAGSGAGGLVSDVAVTIEPGVYLPDRGGVRIEDTVVVTDSGVEVLTMTPRELLEV